MKNKETPTSIEQNCQPFEKPTNMKNKQNTLDWKRLKPYAIVFIILGVLLMFIPLVMVQPWFNIDFTETGQIGDTISGTTVPFISFIGVGVTFMAFWIQFEANENQRDDIQKERFESRFYEMLALHRSNVDEMEISNNLHQLKSRKLLMRMFYEYKYIYFVFKHFSENDFEDQFELERLTELSYRLFFHGLNNDSFDSLNIKIEGKEAQLFEKVAEYLEKIRTKRRDHINSPDKLGDFEDEITLPSGLKFLCKFLYYPFDGHTNRLPHYYRHLYQLTKFIVNDESLGLDRLEKYEYIKIIRAQLSNYEQLLLYYNSFVYGKSWLKKNLFTDYRIIKNVPLIQANFGVAPKDKLGQLNNFQEFNFEDDEKAD